MENSSTAARTRKKGQSKPWKIRLPLPILHKDWEKSSYRVGSDTVITQDILENKSENPVRTTDNQWEHKEQLADHYHITRHPPTWRTEYYTTKTTWNCELLKKRIHKNVILIPRERESTPQGSNKTKYLGRLHKHVLTLVQECQKSQLVLPLRWRLLWILFPSMKNNYELES